MAIIPDLYYRMYHLLPDPLYTVNTPWDEYDAIVWLDPRTKPTEAELLAVTQAQIDAVKLDLEANAIDQGNWNRFQFELHYDMENRMRTQEGLGTITRQIYYDALKARWKALFG